VKDGVGVGGVGQDHAGFAALSSTVGLGTSRRMQLSLRYRF
jgi:hypothetical protein